MTTPRRLRRPLARRPVRHGGWLIRATPLGRRFTADELAEMKCQWLAIQPVPPRLRPPLKPLPTSVAYDDCSRADVAITIAAFAIAVLVLAVAAAWLVIA